MQVYICRGLRVNFHIKMSILHEKNILLGVTGGIAAYKSADLGRRLRDAGANVRIVMTEAATKFIGPITLQAVSGRPVHVHLLDPATESSMGHIDLARWSDIVLVAPASANFLAKLAHGLADDLLTTLCLATRAPIVAAPAMNRLMWSAPATQHNVALLRQRDIRFVGPASGEQACGEFGPGRMTEPETIVAELGSLFPEPELDGLRVMITAGPTHEAIDPVRYIGNRSSGKMGYALAQAALYAGAQVTLVSGPVALDAPYGATLVRIETAAQMHHEVMSRLESCDVFIAAAAVADYQAAAQSEQKIKKGGAPLTLVLEPTPDILADVTGSGLPVFAVGFAAETEDLELHAQAKLEAKNLRMIAANRVGPKLGFDADDNELHVFWRGGGKHLPRAPKTVLAKSLIKLIAERYRAENRA